MDSHPQMAYHVFPLERARGVDRVRLAHFILPSVFALALSGCATGPGFGKAEEPDRPQKEIKQPAATETKPDRKPQPSEEPSAPPPPIKPPAIGGSGG